MGYSNKSRQREYQRAWMANRRSSYLAGKSCVKCASTDHLQWDHVDPATKVTHRFWSWSTERLENELAKCQVLCATCHQEKTANENRDRSTTPHGIRATYQKGCRCEQCKQANTNYRRQARGRSAPANTNE